MGISTLCNRNVATIHPEADILEAAKRMRQAHVGDLIVTRYQDGRETPIGIVTDRDIVLEVVSEGLDPARLTVSDIMKADLLKIDEDSGMEFSLQELHRLGVRRAPVVNSRGELVGILAMDDVIAHLATQLSDIAGTIAREQYVESQTRS